MFSIDNNVPYLTSGTVTLLSAIFVESMIRRKSCGGFLNIFSWSSVEINECKIIISHFIFAYFADESIERRYSISESPGKNISTACLLYESLFFLSIESKTCIICVQNSIISCVNLGASSFILGIYPKKIFFMISSLINIMRQKRKIIIC